ncbi:MAG: MoaD/ThiS family protein [Nitrososphaeraceae archaeon]|nr:MoaD/ThiS family protein [Nitrososphaeraceae archaeon]
MSDVEEMEHHHHPQFITLKVKSFAILKDIIGTQQMTLQLPRKDEGTTVADLRTRILELYPIISEQRIAMGIAVNAKIANEKSVINDLDEIALLPPISGG